ncbi:hypothetical protein [Mesorhizobium sp.]|uniref:hypothetical protein n=1 Tax=Mesorhizobium sp. TaxID=1871066 RepID=UPI00345C4BD6
MDGRGTLRKLETLAFANARTGFHAAKIDRANGMAVLNDIDPALAGQADLERASGGTLALAPNVPAGAYVPAARQS